MVLNIAGFDWCEEEDFFAVWLLTAYSHKTKIERALFAMGYDKGKLYISLFFINIRIV